MIIKISEELIKSNNEVLNNRHKLNEGDISGGYGKVEKFKKYNSEESLNIVKKCVYVK